MSRVVAVIVHWQDLDDTLGCVRSVAAEPGVEAMVVDNGSREPARQRLAAEAPQAVCLTSPENLGFAGGANLGIRAALHRGAEVVLLLNDDVRVLPGANHAAMAVLSADARVAAVGAKVLSREDPRRLWLAWGQVTYGPGLVRVCGAGALDGPAYAREREVEWIAGCAMWIRREALERIGLFDERFFAYLEDVEWCTRARASGWRVVWCPEAVVMHAGRGTTGGSQSIRIRKYFAARNAILFARKHATTPQRLKLWSSLLVSLPLQLLWHWPRGTAGEVGLKIAGVRDAVLGRRPPFEALGLR